VSEKKEEERRKENNGVNSGTLRSAAAVATPTAGARTRSDQNIAFVMLLVAGVSRGVMF
jgi:hypothetical protein